ncbi:restriction endonuclease subunit S, partial [Vibrio parahaemolyticus]
DDSIDISEWKKFKICGSDDSIFKLVQPSPRTLTEYIYDGDVPFVASGSFNNGVEKYVEVKEGESLDKGNCISVSAIGGFSFYQKNDFIGRGG